VSLDLGSSNGLSPPIVVGNCAERAAEAVAARARDGIDDAAGEAAVLGGDAEADTVAP
jgi:hypothetical protein